jgi:nucleotide-binding universal stress UspA family protein
MKKILFPLDTRSENKVAFCYGAALARMQEARLVMLNVFELDADINSLSAKQLARLRRKRWMEALESIFEIKGHYIDNFATAQGDLELKTGYRIVLGKANSVILKTLQSEDFDLLVLNWAAHRSEERDALTELAKAVLETTGTAVLFVPEKADLEKIHRIAYATDFLPLLNGEHLIKQSRNLAHLFDASLEFIHCSKDGSLHDVNDKASLNLVNKLAATNERYRLTVLTGPDPLEEIENYCASNAIGLLIAVKKKRSFLSRFFHSSFTGRLANTLSIPVLMMKDETPIVTKNEGEQPSLSAAH